MNDLREYAGFLAEWSWKLAKLAVIIAFIAADFADAWPEGSVSYFAALAFRLLVAAWLILTVIAGLKVTVRRHDEP